MSCKCENLEDKIIKYNNLLYSGKGTPKVFEELNVHNECCRKKIHDAFMRPQQERKSIVNDINLILVSKKARPAALIERPTDKEIRKIKRKYPNLIYTVAVSPVKEGTKGYFVSYKKIPIRKKDENIYVYIGRVLGYQYAIDIENTIPRYFVKYYALSDKEDIDFFSEGIRFKSHYKSNKEKFSKALKPYGYTVKEVIKKNPKYKN